MVSPLKPECSREVIRFFVPGTPRPQGSKVGFRSRTGKVVLKDMGTDLEAWRATVAAFARRVYQGPPLQGPVILDLVFLMPRPKAHFRAGDRGKGLKPTAPGWHAQTPDRTKILRAVEDALKGILWLDDSQVVDGAARKAFANGTTGVDVAVRPAGEWHGPEH